MLKWARENGCPWSPTVCARAAAVGNVEALQWLREKGCPWNYLVWSSAVAGNHVGIEVGEGDAVPPDAEKSPGAVHTYSRTRTT